MLTVIKEFKEFLKEYKIAGLAIAFIIGTAATALVKALVDDIVMPFIAFALPAGDWQKSVLPLGPILIKWGDFLSVAINFMIIAFVIFLFAKFVLGEEKVAKK